MSIIILKRMAFLLFALFMTNATIAQKTDRTNAYMYNRNGQYDQAVQSIEKSINHSNFYEMSSKDQAQAWLYRGVIYLNIHQDAALATKYPDCLEKAYASLENCIKADPDFAKDNAQDVYPRIAAIAVNYFQEGVTNFNNKEYSTAAVSFRKAYNISLNGHAADTSALFNAALAYQRAKMYNEAIANYQELKKLGWNNAEINKKIDDCYKEASHSIPSRSRPVGSSQSNVAFSHNSQWDVFNSISSIKRIDLVFDADDRVLLSSSPNSINSDATRFWKANEYGNAQVYFTIFGDYSVSMSYRTKMYSERDDNKGRGCGVELALNGTGVLAWESERMVIRLNVTETVSGGEYDFYNYSANTTECHIYDSDSHSSTFTYEVVMSSINSNQIMLKGNDITSSIRGVKCYAGGEYRQNWYFHTIIKLANKPIRINVEQKSQSEKNAQNSDMYGKWQWNNDRSVIYLESTTKDACLVLWNNDGNLSWGFQLSNTATGYKTETADSGQDLAYLMLSFDGASEQSFSFVRTGNNLVYAQYDRFLGILKHDASIISQIKDKRTLILNYKQNGVSKTAMFQLEGLEAIYNAITQ